MNKHTFSLIALAIVFVSVFAACKKDKDTAVTGVTLNVTTKALLVDETLTLTATVLPENATNKNVTWSTSDANIATVADGVVTAKKVGTATITVTTVDGSKTATCTVTVAIPLPKDWEVEGFGKGNFASDTLWIVDKQAWSDAVTTTVCSGKTTFSAGQPMSGNYTADCRSNPGQKGDLFSWEMVKLSICPEGWRVPSKEDFETLNEKFGATDFVGNTDADQNAVKQLFDEVYLNPEKWGGSMGGWLPAGNPDIVNPGMVAQYWSSTSQDADFSIALKLASTGTKAIFLDGNGNFKANGASVRCVRDL